MDGAHEGATVRTGIQTEALELKRTIPPDSHGTD